jgi:hypothetical protein
MSKTKRSPTIAEQDEYRKLVDRLVAGGADFDLSTFTHGSKPRIQIIQVPEMFASYAGASPRGFHYVVYVHIVALVGKVKVKHFDLSSAEWEMGTYPIEDPSFVRSGELYYRPGDGSSYFRDEVLNHRLDKKILHSGDVMEGRLLFGSLTPIPKHHVHRSRMTATLSIWDQFDELYEADIELLVDRTTDWPVQRPSRGTGLFEPSDRVIAASDQVIVPVVDPTQPQM